MLPPFVWLRRLLRLSLVLLPYISYLGFLGILIVLLAAGFQAKRTVLDSQTRHGLMLISGLMVVSCGVAYHPPEAFVQLGNFLPFFLFFAIAPLVLQRLEHWQQTATELVLSILPLNLLSLGEYWLKSPYLPGPWQQVPWIAALRLAPYPGRAMVTFHHPNAFASYLVLILGLGLGLLLSQFAGNPTRIPANGVGNNFWLLGATFSCLGGIFASGSRNGFLVALIQVGLFLLLTRLYSTLRFSAWVALGTAIGGVTLLGIGGRSLAPTTWVNDPRLGAWGVAWELIRERPWLGWGLGNYKILFPPRTFDPIHYPKMFHPHNIWLLLASETGLIVTGLITALVGYLCYRAVRVWLSHTLSPAENGVLLAYLLGFGGAIAYGLFDVTLYDGRVHVLNWFLLAGIYFFGQVCHSPRIGNEGG